MILVETEDEELDERARLSGKLLEYFQPAIANDILRIETVSVSSVDIDSEIARKKSRSEQS